MMEFWDLQKQNKNVPPGTIFGISGLVGGLYDMISLLLNSI